jgi:hypothetical protein
MRAVVAALMEEAHRASVSGRRALARQRYESGGAAITQLLLDLIRRHLSTGIGGGHREGLQSGSIHRIDYN